MKHRNLFYLNTKMTNMYHFVAQYPDLHPSSCLQTACHGFSQWGSSRYTPSNPKCPGDNFNSRPCANASLNRGKDPLDPFGSLWAVWHVKTWGVILQPKLIQDDTSFHDRDSLFLDCDHPQYVKGMIPQHPQLIITQQTRGGPQLSFSAALGIAADVPLATRDWAGFTALADE